MRLAGPDPIVASPTHPALFDGPESDALFKPALRASHWCPHPLEAADRSRWAMHACERLAPSGAIEVRGTAR